LDRIFEKMMEEIIGRAQGCLLGQLAGDSLGSLVEFKHAEDIRILYPQGIGDLADGGTWNTLAGQPTDDSEMALILARSLINERTYLPTEALKGYRYWLNSGPFDCGRTIHKGLAGNPDHSSEANGALMRVSPLGIFGAFEVLSLVSEWAQADAKLTHPNPICLQANSLFTRAVSRAVRNKISPEELYNEIMKWASEMSVDSLLVSRLETAKIKPPHDFFANKGWVMVALHNALYQLLHAPSVEAAIVDTVMRGGDTDTNAAICGALMGAVHGIRAIPEKWVRVILNCRPMEGGPGVYKPRPECFWPVDALNLAEELVYAGQEKP
jgi:ADP-ribosyl-[dinitrogen reductase] hydrolase